MANIGKSNFEQVIKVCERAESMGITTKDRRVTHVMDIDAAMGDVNIDLDAWVNGADFDFAHDFVGIYNHMDREFGKLTDCFLPRFAR